MYGSLQLKSLVDQRHEAALRDARMRRLAEEANGNKAARFWLRDVVSAVSGALSVRRL